MSEYSEERLATGIVNQKSLTSGYLQVEKQNGWNFCPNCGKKLCDEWNFCPSCGSTLSGWTYVAHPPSGDWGYMGGAVGWQWYPHLTPKCKSAQCNDNVARYQSTPPTK